MKFIAIIFVLLLTQLCGSNHSTTQGVAHARTDDAAQAKEINKIADAPVICVDPGHPSEVSSGRAEQNGTNETHIAWEVAQKLKTLLEARGYRVVMTKDSESQLVTNKERALIANRANAALTVRLHCDASSDKGFALYYPDRKGATKDGVTGPDEDVMTRSRRAADALHDGMVSILGERLKDGGVRGDSKTLVGSKQGALTGSIFSRVPVVTIEMVTLSDKADAEFIKAEQGQELMARAIAEGVARYVKVMGDR